MAGSVEEDRAVDGVYLSFNMAFGVIFFSPYHPYDQAGETQAGDKVDAKLTGQPGTKVSTAMQRSAACQW